jgi:hypothetical protein
VVYACDTPATMMLFQSTPSKMPPVMMWKIHLKVSRELTTER